MNKITVVKIGGGVLENVQEMEVFLNQFASIKGNKILIHGGGREASKVAEKLGIPTKMVEGRRVTDSQTLDVVTMVYGGLINKKTVAKLQSKNCNAIGITGADARLIIASKRTVKEVDYGFVGDIEHVNSHMLEQLIEMGLTPVVSPLSFEKSGILLNTNADTMASAIATSLVHKFEVTLLYCFEKQGVLSNPNDEDSIVPLIDSESYEKLKQDGIIKDGMIPKLDSCFDALEKGVKDIWIINSKNVNTKQGTKLTN